MSLDYLDHLGWGFTVICCALASVTFVMGEAAWALTDNPKAKAPWDVLACSLIIAGLFLPF